MPWKMDDQGHIAVLDGNPVWVGDDGSEVGFDAKANIVAAATARREAAESRKALKDATEKLKGFEGIEDPKEAVEAMQFKRSLDGKKLWDDESTQKAINAALKPVQDENEQLKKAVSDKDATIFQMKVSDKFNTSSFLKDKTIFAETPDIAEAYFGKHFKVEDGKTIAYDHSGSPIYSSVKAGEYADFDEALSILINNHPRKEHMLKGSGASGSGSAGGAGGGAGAKSVTRSAFESLSPGAQMDHIKNGGVVTD